ncbi:MAG: hypothetical protein D6734_10425 [Candidatus Schekmanbacteria bacterium]|nr:MAG: hypothetical protein D6734_10425 [Candidatus Schekmanbacteria bacterium]
MALPFYIGKTFPEDESWTDMLHNLKAKKVAYLVNDDTLEEIYSILPHGVDIKELGKVGRSIYFLISNFDIKEAKEN